MAHLTISFFSKRLNRDVTINALLPVDGSDKPDYSSTSLQPPLKSLYLLNGLTGNHTDWVSYTRIRKLANLHNIAVFMPGGENHFYVDDEEREEYYGQFVGEELVEFTRQCFPLSHKREDTYIGGLSMGGYGAVRNGLKYAKRFGAIIGLSSALLPYRIANAKPGFEYRTFKFPYLQRVFGDLSQLFGSDKDPEALIKQLRHKKEIIPHIFLSCGTEDFLIDMNRRYHQFLLDEAVEHTYIEKPGAHTWEYWDEGIEDALNWITHLNL
ncbi:alpha/beta hydrolase [Paenibacillus endoradicis]|uniref:alpha/beta hydrolase n=1 Tax=Paenibacillus endoradicis TaxID=2972487 RepID=UPI002158C5E3|nr:alpha/beta hydrolase-fold protein [Paenibacillus endoradicis]MCR8659743.1 alpha/beta hydrolase-fold protein [Paenibacillus endoradicis]